MPIRAAWVANTAYVIGDVVVHEAVWYTCTQDHLSVPGANGNEPDACPDDVWRQFWIPNTASWGDYTFGRWPSWVQALDVPQGNPFYRFLRILGRSLNQTDDDSQRLALIKDVDQTPTAYLDTYAADLGILLPHTFDTIDPNAARRYIANIVALYKRKGCLPSLEFIATAYLGIEIDIIYETVVGHFYVATYNDAAIASDQRATYFQELQAIFALYQPAGLTAVIWPSSVTLDVGTLGGGGGSSGVPYSPGVGDVGSSTGAMFTLNVLYPAT